MGSHIPQRGVQPYIVPSGQAVNEDVYIDKCIRARLIPFIEENHKNDEIVFWPDLASSHYSNKVQAYLKAKNIDFVPKSRNIAGVPELWPIEDFWAYIKRQVYKNNWAAENLDQLRRRIEYVFKNLDSKLVHKLGKASFTRVDAARRHGIKNLYFLFYFNKHTCYYRIHFVLIKTFISIKSYEDFNFVWI